MMSSSPHAPVSDALAFVGGGNMARSLIGALVRSGIPASGISVAEPNESLRRQLAEDFGVKVFSEGSEAVRGADIVLLAVKPQVMRTVCVDIADAVAARRPLIISIAAGLRIAQIDRWLGGGFPIVRCMPNTPALIGAGATGMIANGKVDAAARAQAQAILGSSGLSVWIEREELMDTVTGVSGSGPAYFFLMIEALEDAGVAQGLPRETARTLAIQTCLGAARMASEDDEPPARLRERVTSPNGTTAAALDAFAKGGLRELVARAVDAATARGAEMSRELD
ncbi:MAG: pyrroline-5-carboxylate reductase [Xanthomonadales bacterium]|uniref:pyrroline-5-carboxylate reductase n=3 Tax=Dokdonella sp. TaxID=2291710 RepID=UPI002C01638F|nr:pyrroline-5-carboxylate reductase [Xanthomonadales bacterium]HQV71368.1 pyrroline-5-carboxylate reductase [Dokdonella sp.]MBK7012433.1 pyrroline-5-carboxylate reductase [Xanthomonadales bacterium]MBK7210773.1 pyrroline-5-carboxylate reductase [Xanthomonadales bacterium]MBL0223025.1 pyrroline-5-carboxylate reductase [Xanthomonadales bacterium]